MMDDFTASEIQIRNVPDTKDVFEKPFLFLCGIQTFEATLPASGSELNRFLRCAR